MAGELAQDQLLPKVDAKLSFSALTTAPLVYMFICRFLNSRAQHLSLIGIWVFDTGSNARGVLVFASLINATAAPSLRSENDPGCTLVHISGEGGRRSRPLPRTLPLRQKKRDGKEGARIRINDTQVSKSQLVRRDVFPGIPGTCPSTTGKKHTCSPAQSKKDRAAAPTQFQNFRAHTGPSIQAALAGIVSKLQATVPTDVYPCTCSRA